MLYKEKGTYTTDKWEPVMRSCWECNSSHKHLKNTNKLHVCFVCGKYWIHGRFLDSFKSEAEMDKFLKKKLKPIS